MEKLDEDGNRNKQEGGMKDGFGKLIEVKTTYGTAGAEDTVYPWVKRNFKINRMVHEVDADFRKNNRVDLVKQERWDNYLMELVRNIAYVQAQIITRTMLSSEPSYGIPTVALWPFSQERNEFWHIIKREAHFLTKPDVSFNEIQKKEIRDYFRHFAKKVAA